MRARLASRLWLTALAGASVLATAALVACSSDGVLGSLARDGAEEAGSDASAADGDSTGEGGAPSPLPIATAAIAAGGASTCVRNALGQERCWGENLSGSLGIGDTQPSSSATPVAPMSLGKVQALAAGETAQCALGTDGKVSCWGDIFFGDFNSQPIDHLPVANPLELDVTGPVAQIAVGRYFTCFLGTGGAVQCFGLGDHGQLGNGSTDKKYLPTTVTGFDGFVTSISASMGGLFACATTVPGTVYCWGATSAASILSQPGDVLRPTKVPGFADGERAVQVVAGASHACVRLVSGTVKCWGKGDSGQLGNGMRVSSATPVDTLYVSDVATLAAGAAHTCAVTLEGAVLCWGNDQDGEAGQSPDPTRPWLVEPASFGAKHVSCGLAHTCAWAIGGHVVCWGSNASSQLGPRDATF